MKPLRPQPPSSTGNIQLKIWKSSPISGHSGGRTREGHEGRVGAVVDALRGGFERFPELFGVASDQKLSEWKRRLELYAIPQTLRRTDILTAWVVGLGSIFTIWRVWGVAPLEATNEATEGESNVRRR